MIEKSLVMFFGFDKTILQLFFVEICLLGILFPNIFMKEIIEKKE
jgi:hypothetical protein